MAISLKEVYEICYKARHKWPNMLLALDVSNPSIESIRMKFHGDPDDCFRMGLSDWLSSGTERTWEHVVAALLSPTVDCKDIADQVAKKYLDEIPCTKEWTTDAGPTSEKLQRVNDNLIIFTSEHVGNGAFGTVFKGQYRNSPCAVKVMHHVAVQMQTKLPTGQGNKSTTQSFEREYNFLTTCVHPNVVKVLSTEKCSLWENIILVMELMDCNLKHYLSSLGEMPLGDKIEVSLCKNVASGLAYIHSKQIMHRDLCGDNILLKLHSMPIAKISDFGMSKLIDPTKLSSTLSALTHRNGYLPPEAIQSDERTYDQSLDIFSFGVIMVQIVCKVETIQSAKQRQMYFEKIPHIHRLKSLIVSCLQDCKRPNATSICVSLENELHHAGQMNQTIKLAEREHSMTFDATIYTFGFGSDHDASLLENIATQGGGAYYFVESDEKIPKVFGDCLGGLLSVMGQNITLKFELQGDNSAAEVHANRTINWTSPKKICEIGIGDLQSKEERDIVLKLKLPLLPFPQQDLVLKASLLYYNVITDNIEHDAVCLYIHRNNDEQGLLNKDVDVHRNRIIATKALKKAKSQADTNNLDDAHETLLAAIEQLKGSTSAQHTLCKEMETDLRRCREGTDSPVAYRQYGKHLMSNRTQAHRSQRSNFVGIGSTDLKSPYRTPYKSDMVDASMLSPRVQRSDDY